MDTQMEGDWVEVVPVIRAAQMRLLERHSRVFLTLSVDEHRGSPGSLSRVGMTHARNDSE